MVGPQSCPACQPCPTRQAFPTHPTRLRPRSSLARYGEARRSAFGAEAALPAFPALPDPVRHRIRRSVVASMAHEIVFSLPPISIVIGAVGENAGKS